MSRRRVPREMGEPEKSLEREKARMLAAATTAICSVIRTFIAAWRFFDGG